MMERPTDPRPRRQTAVSGSNLYAIIDVPTAADPIALARSALRAKCAFLQLRVKRMDDRTFLDLAHELRALCGEAHTPFVVNDRADIARLVRADGLHVGQDDLSVADARKAVPGLTIGVSTHDPEQAAKAQRDGADLIAFGPVFPTSTKERPDPVVGLEMLAHICRAVTRPVVAIGGITPSNARATLEAGARHFAVISALPRFVDKA